MHPPQAEDRFSVRWVGGVTAGTIVLTIVLSVIAAYTVLYYRDRFNPAARPDTELLRSTLPANTQLEYHLFRDEPIGEGRRFRAAERAYLDSWGWVGRERTRVRIPIAEAMELVAEGQRQREGQP